MNEPETLRGFLHRQERKRVEAAIRAECDRGTKTLWTDAFWYAHLSRDEIQAILSEYGYGPLTPSNRPRAEALRELRAVE